MRKTHLSRELRAQKAVDGGCYHPAWCPLTSGTLQQSQLALETAAWASPGKKKIFQWEYGQTGTARWATWRITSMESTVRHVDLTLPHFPLEVAACTLDRERKRMIPCDLECRCAMRRDRRVRQEEADIALSRRQFKRAFFPSRFCFFFSLGKTRKRAPKLAKRLQEF